MTTSKKFIALFVLFALLLCSVIGLVACDDSNSTDGYFTVTYVYGNGQSNNTVSVKSGELATEPRTPTYEGHTFLGWFRDGDSVAYDFSTPVTESFTLTARWQETTHSGSDIRLNWRNSDAASFYFEEGTPRTAKAGDVIKFGITTSPYYSIPQDGAITVTATGKEIVRETSMPDGKEFTYTIPQNATGTILFEIAGLERDSTVISGSGTASDPYLIKNAAQFKAMSDAINNYSDSRYNAAYISLEADLDFKGETLKPIGANLGYASMYFSGEFYGNGHTISRFSIEVNEGIVGLFGYVAEGGIYDLHVQDVDYTVTADDTYNYIIGGIVAYNIGSDIIGCSVNADFNVNLEVSGPTVYVGGIVGFAQGYGTDYAATISYCSVEGDIYSSGFYPLHTVGGIAGAMYGTAESAPAFITNCVYVGDIGSASSVNMCGGIVGYLRSNTAVANSYAQGSFSSQESSGGIVGLAENETAVTYSYAVANLIKLRNMTDSNVKSGNSVVGSYYKQGDKLEGLFTSIDGKEVVIHGSYVAVGGKINGTDVSNFSAVKSLLGWADADWDFVNGRPVVKPSGEAEVKLDVTFQFLNNVTVDGKGTDVIHVEGGYIPTYWAQDGSGKNTFLADNGSISYGFYFDEECTERVPAAMPLTQSMTIYVAFADYSEVAGTYYATIVVRSDGSTVERIDLTLEFNELGMMTMRRDGMVAYYMYVYDGEKIYIRNAYFVYFAYTSNTSSLYTDFYAEIGDNGTLTIYDNCVYTPAATMQAPITAYKRTAVVGEWYDSANTKYTFNADGTGTSSIEGQFTYTYVNDIVTISLGSKTIVARLSGNDDHMESTDGSIIFSVTKFDEFTGTWEAEYGLGFSITFDGKGNVTVGEGQYKYTINSGELTFNNGKQYTANFNADGLLVLTCGDEKLTLGRAGSYIGIWTETWYDYSIRLYGVGRDGYGYAVDSRGYNLTYSAELVEDKVTDEEGNVQSTTSQYYLTFYYRTSMYGFGYEQPATLRDEEKDLGKGSLLYLSMFTPESGMMVDDYSMTYIDIFEGTWNATDGTSLQFNGYGGYNIEYQMVGDGSWWIAKGEVTVTQADGTAEKVRYEFDRNTQSATFKVNDVQYTATYTSAGLSVSANGTQAKQYIAPDEFAGVTFQSEDGSILSFNGKSNVNLGKATLTIDGEATTYDYTIVDGKAILKQGGATVYTASVNMETYMLDLEKAADSSTVSFGMYSPMFGKIYHLSVNGLSFELHGVFDLRGRATATFMGYEVVLELYAENAVAVYFGKYLEYYIVCIGENNIALFNSYQQLIGMLCVLDDWGGTYVSANGDVLYIDGRGLIYGYYPTASLKTEEGSITYVYELGEDGTITLSLKTDDELVPCYIISRTNSNGATAFVSEDGLTTLYLTAIV